MNRREFAMGAVAVAVSAALPKSRDPDLYFRGVKIVWDEFTHDGTDWNMQFCNTVWWQHSNPDILIADEVVIKELRKAWGECERV